MLFEQYISLKENITTDIILKQFNKLALPSWKAKGFVDMNDGIKFTVSGSKFKGYVYIKKSNNKDNYDIIFGKIIKSTWKEVKKINNVYVDKLVNLIDNIIG